MITHTALPLSKRMKDLIIKLNSILRPDPITLDFPTDLESIIACILRKHVTDATRAGLSQQPLKISFTNRKKKIKIMKENVFP